MEKLRDHEKAQNFSHSALEKRLDITAIALEKRLESMNEFRSQLNFQASAFITRKEVDFLLDNISKEVKILNSYKDMMTGKASQTSVNLATLLAIF